MDWHRFVTQAQFAGTVEPGTRYVLVDDHVGLGGTTDLMAALESGRTAVSEAVVQNFHVTVRRLTTKIRPGTLLSAGLQPLFVRSKPAEKIAEVVRSEYAKKQFEQGSTLLLVRTRAEDLDDIRYFRAAMEHLTQDQGGDPKTGCTASNCLGC